jgi:hypothetical protein
MPVESRTAQQLTVRPQVQQGTTWSGGKLYYFHPEYVEVMRVWPDPRAWRKDFGEGWKHVLSARFHYDGHRSSAERLQTVIARVAHGQPTLPHPRDVPEIQYNQRLRRQIPDWEVWQAIPPRVGAQLSGLGGRDWHLLTLLAHVPAALELSESNRAVAWILASSRDFAPCAQPMRRARSLVALPRHELLGRLGWPARKAVVKLLGRVDPLGLWNVRHVLELRDRSHDEDFLREAGHLPVIGPDTLRLLADPALCRLAQPSLWRESAERPPEFRNTPIAGWLAHAVELARDLHRDLAPIASVQQLRSLIADLWRGQAELADRDGLTQAEFGGPPVPQPEGMTCEPIESYERLRQESEQMHNCVASPAQRYVHAIRAGRGYAFHLSHPATATVFIERAGEVWKLAEVKGPCNSPVPAWLVARLRAWVEGLDPRSEPA